MKAFVLTGVGAGLGRALHDILLSDEFKNDQKVFISRSLRSHKKNRKNCTYLSMDFLNPIVEPIAEAIHPSTKTIIFLNNAGVINPIGPALSIDGVDLKKSLMVNLYAPVGIAQSLGRLSEVLNAEFIIFNVSSGAANRPVKGWMPYCVGKAAARMAFDVMAAESEQVSVLHFDPGVMDTGMQNYIRDRTELEMPDVYAFKKMKDTLVLKAPEGVARSILDLLRGFSL